MGLQVKRAPVQLRPEIVETVWPGDSAVDLEQSDLVAWCRDGGKAGLTFKPNEKPDIIRWRPLDEFAFGRVAALMAEGSRNLPLAAFRHGVISVGGVRVIRTRIDDADGLHDDTMRDLGTLVLDLPFHHALNSMRLAISGAEEDGAVSDEVLPASLPQVVGCHILAATFRARRRDA